MNHQHLLNYGLTPHFEQEALLYPELTLARVTRQHKNLYTIATETNEVLASVSGHFLHHAEALTRFPATGDWVMVSFADKTNQRAVIHHVLHRKSVFERKAAWTSNNIQIVAANIDYIFICISLNTDFNLRRLERYLSIAWESSASPVIVLTKADLCDNLPDKLAQVASVNTGADVLVTATLADDIQALIPYLNKDKTIVFLGSSGVGKSTLINKLMGEEVLVTQTIGNDDSGKHTTTHRQLFVLPMGGVVIDTPGMRELQLDSANLSKTFEDIDQLSQQCKFRNCTHTTEPGCAVQQAITDKALTSGRLENYRKLEKEIEYEGLNAREMENTKLNHMFGSKGEYKQFKRQIKQKK